MRPLVSTIPDALPGGSRLGLMDATSNAGDGVCWPERAAHKHRSTTQARMVAMFTWMTVREHGALKSEVRWEKGSHAQCTPFVFCWPFCRRRDRPGRFSDSSDHKRRTASAEAWNRKSRVRGRLFLGRSVGI